MAKIDTDIVVAGGGAAGLMAAAAASESGKAVIVVEKMPRVARKMMITGKGRCNFTNMKDWNEFSTHIHPKPNVLKPAFYNFTPSAVVEFFRRWGLDSVVERGDRVFPASYRAVDVVDTLLKAAESSGAKVMTGRAVLSIDRVGGGFVLRTASASDAEDPGQILEIGCRKLIVATGGLSYPSTGSTGDGYKWAEAFGLKISPCLPSLTALVPEGYKTVSAPLHIDRSVPMSACGRSLNGLQLKNVQVSLIVGGNVVDSDFGDVDFTDGGIEGPLGFRLSRRAVKALNAGDKVSLSIDMKPAVGLDALEREVEKLWKSINNDNRSFCWTNGRRRPKPYSDRLKILLMKLMPREMITAFCSTWSSPDVSALASRLKNWTLKIVGFVGYERCVVTSGGVSTDEIVPKTLESRTVSGLYFAGEVLDLDGDTGGYNLQLAFCTGRLAGQCAAR